MVAGHASASGYQNVLRHPSVGTMVMPEMVGGVFDFYADAQQHIAVKPRRRRAAASSSASRATRAWSR